MPDNALKNQAPRIETLPENPGEPVVEQETGLEPQAPEKEITQHELKDRSAETVEIIDGQTAEFDDRLMNQTAGTAAESGLPPDRVEGVFARLNIAERLSALQQKVAEAAERTKRSIVNELKLAGVLPPMSRGEEFDPKSALEELKSDVGGRNPNDLELYKLKLVRQKEGFARIQGLVLDAVRDNPDLTKVDFVNLTNGLRKKYGVTEGQFADITRYYNIYKNRHNAIRKAFEEHPEPSDMYEFIFGAKPVGRVEIIQDPMSIYFRCHSEEDFARAYTGKIKESDVLGQDDLETVQKAGGALLPGAGPSDLKGTIMIENAHGAPYGPDQQSIHDHEEQHALHTLFSESRLKRQFHHIALEKADTPQDAEKILKWHFRSLREMELPEAKDEVLAFLKGGTVPEDIPEHLLVSKSAGGLYDFFERSREEMPEWARNKNPLLSEEACKRITEEVYDREYRKILSDAIEAYTSVRELGSMPDARILALFEHEQLEDWVKVSRRFLSQ